MDGFYEILYVLLPWLCFLLVLRVFTKLIAWARNRKAAAIALGLLVQMFLPDPNVQKTMQVVVEQKQQKVKKQSGSASPDLDENARHKTNC